MYKSIVVHGLTFGYNRAISTSMCSGVKHISFI